MSRPPRRMFEVECVVERDGTSRTKREEIIRIFSTWGIELEWRRLRHDLEAPYLDGQRTNPVELAECYGDEWAKRYRR